MIEEQLYGRVGILLLMCLLAWSPCNVGFFCFLTIIYCIVTILFERRRMSYLRASHLIMVKPIMKCVAACLLFYGTGFKLT